MELLNEWKYSLLVVIFVTQILIIIVPFIGKIRDNRRVFWYRFTGLGYFLVGCCVVSFSASYAFFRLTEFESNNYQVRLTEELNRRDSLHQIRVDSINSNIVQGFAEYGLKYDVAEKRIAKLVRDSSRQIIIVGPRPDFGIFSIKEIEDSIDVHTLQIVYSSKQASSYNINFKVLFVSVDDRWNLSPFLEDGKGHGTLAPNTNVTKDQEVISGIWLSKLPKRKGIVFRIVGSYEDERGKKIPLDRMYIYEIEPKRFGNPTPFLDKKLRSYFVKK